MFVVCFKEYFCWLLGFVNFMVFAGTVSLLNYYSVEDIQEIIVGLGLQVVRLVI